MKCLYVLICLSVTVFSYGQGKRFNPHNSYQDITVSGGIYANTNNDLLTDGTVYSVDYANFAYSGIGFRAGVSFVDQLDNNINIFCAPLSFAWRTPLGQQRSVVENIGLGLGGYIQSPSHNVGSAFFSMIPFRLELNAGLTPGTIAGNGFYNQRWSSFLGEYMYGVSVRNRFILSADVGFRATVRVWRLNMMLSPQYHYWLTDNFSRRSTLASLNSEKLSRSYMSFNFGLGYLF